MAFRATRALHFCGQESLEAAVTWLAQHEEDTGLDEPLLVPKVSVWQRPTACLERVPSAHLAQDLLIICAPSSGVCSAKNVSFRPDHERQVWVQHGVAVS